MMNLNQPVKANNFQENLHPRLQGKFAPKMGETQPSKDKMHKSSSQKETHPNFDKAMSKGTYQQAVIMPRISKYTFDVAKPASVEETEQQAEEGKPEEFTSDFIVDSPFIEPTKLECLSGKSTEELLTAMMANQYNYSWFKLIEEANISKTTLSVLAAAGVRLEHVDWFKNSGEYDYGSNCITLRKNNRKKMALRFIDEGTHAITRFILGESGFPQEGRSSFATWQWTLPSDIKAAVATEYNQLYDVETIEHGEDADGDGYDYFKPRFEGIEPYGGKICILGHEYLGTVAQLKFREALGQDVSKKLNVYETHAPVTVKLVKMLWFEEYLAENMAITADGFATVDACVLCEGNIKYEKESAANADTDSFEYEIAYLPKEELNEAALSTLEGVPVVAKSHSWRTTRNFRDTYTVGWVVGKPSLCYTNSGKMAINCKLRIMDAQAINELKAEGRRMVSAGYVYQKDATPGVSPYGEYDYTQKNLRFNHILIVPTGQHGRCGPEVSIIS